MSWYQTRYLNIQKLPLVVEPINSKISKEEFFKALQQDKEQLRQLLLEHGGILFRGFPLMNHEDFSGALKALNVGKFLDYIGGDSPRNKIAEGIYTSTEAPPSVKIPLHNELSFVKYHPRHIFFFCETPSEIGGETIVADSRKVYSAVDPIIRERFIQRGLKYVSRYYYKSSLMNFINWLQPSHKSWIQVFETENKDEVEKKCRENEFEYHWNKDDWIQIDQTRPAATIHPITKENIWFNQAHLFDFNPKLLGWSRYAAATLFYCRSHTKLHEIFFADGVSLPQKDLYHILDVLDSQTIAFSWKRGDLLALDNMLAMHGRNPFQGKRRILTAMTG